MPASEATSLSPATAPSGQQGLGAPGVMAWSIAHGLLTVVAFEVPALWPAAWVMAVPLAWLALRSRRLSHALVATAIVQMATWMWLDRWLVPVTLAGYPLLAVYQSIYGVLFVALIRGADHHRRLGRLPMALVVPVVWVGVEALRGEIAFDGYPWFLAAHPMIEALPLVQSADLLGTYFVSLIVVSIAGAVVDGLRWRAGAVSGRFALASAVMVVAVQGANLAYGAWRTAENPPATGDVRVLVIQTNLPQDNKIGWTPEKRAEDVPRFIEMTRQAVDEAGGAVDLIVWPETMVPGVGLEPDTIAFLQRLDERFAPAYRWGLAVTDLQRQLGKPMLVGSIAWIGARIEQHQNGRRLGREREFNSAYLIDGEPPYQRYDKYQLTPFGETMPYISAWPWLEQALLGLGARGMEFSLDRNPRINRLTLATDDGPVRLATPICYEDTVARVCRRMVYGGGAKQVDILINLSNDGWFGAVDVVRRQHGQIARFRAIENRVPLIRAANTGQSLAVDARGRVIATVGPGRYGVPRRSGWLVVDLPLDGRHTLYGRLGEVCVYGCAAVIGALALALVVERRRRKRHEGTPQLRRAGRQGAAGNKARRHEGTERPVP
jgi:apolipoprotein N-acyltransferase